MALGGAPGVRENIWGFPSPRGMPLPGVSLGAGTFLQALIVVLRSEIRQIRTCGFHGILPGEQNSITLSKVLIFELYLVNLCGAERGTMIVLSADNPFARSLQLPLL
ncbi:hypothetical protein E3N88_10552 [Mikania micrantha]|uniref:Uncharacterized protein n=1 Tax=Mikania micrantha TaxID=192012 RepID=A0A5N6PAT9_9ASTR|nr:hypothetical protein E3N88_10552 [Mikania micrantha]